MEERKNPYEGKSTHWLRRHDTLIKDVLRFRGGQEPKEFLEIHKEPECKVTTLIVGVSGSGFYDTDGYEAPYWHYVYQCNGHDNARSNQFGDFKAWKDAVYDEDFWREIQEYAKARYGNLGIHN